MAKPSFTAENFSSGYVLVTNAEIDQWCQDRPAMDYLLYEALRRRYGEPVVGKVEGKGYQFEPTREVLASRCAVPESNHQDPTALLIEK